MNALSSQNLSMKLCKIQIALGFARNMIFFFNFFYSFFDDQLKVETQNIFDPLKKGKKKQQLGFPQLVQVKTTLSVN